MNLQTTKNINVDFYDKEYILINAKQYDKNSRFLLVTCYDQGKFYNLNSNEHSAYVRYKKSDGFAVLNHCEITGDGKILFELTEQMLASVGICYADLIIVYKVETDVSYDDEVILSIDSSSILSTMTFCIDVSETAVQNMQIESSYQYDGLNEALQMAEAEYTRVIKFTAQSEANAAQSASNAATSASDAATSANNASGSASAASISAANAKTSETAAGGYASTANASMSSAINSASSASESATKAETYYLQTEAITNGLNGAFSPKGTITFAELIELKESGAVAAGYLYHISDDFTTDDNFRVSGKSCGAGTSVYYTVDEKFDCFVGANVAGVKGKNETEYRTGMVNITPENIGAVSTTDIATVDEIKNYLGI